MIGAGAGAPRSPAGWPRPRRLYRAACRRSWRALPGNRDRSQWPSCSKSRPSGSRTRRCKSNPDKRPPGYRRGPRPALSRDTPRRSCSSSPGWRVWYRSTPLSRRSDAALPRRRAIRILMLTVDSWPGYTVSCRGPIRLVSHLHALDGMLAGRQSGHPKRLAFGQHSNGVAVHEDFHIVHVGFEHQAAELGRGRRGGRGVRRHVGKQHVGVETAAVGGGVLLVAWWTRGPGCARIPPARRPSRCRRPEVSAAPSIPFTT